MYDTLTRYSRLAGDDMMDAKTCSEMRGMMPLRSGSSMLGPCEPSQNVRRVRSVLQR